MRLKPEGIKAHFDKQFRQGHGLADSSMWAVWISSDEPLFRNEAADEVRAQCRELGFNQRQVYQVGTDFDWNGLAQQFETASLFAEQSVLQLHLIALPSDAGRKVLLSWLERPPADTFVLILSDRIESKTLNTKWFKQFEQSQAHVPIWPMKSDGLASWLARRANQAGLHLTAPALTLLQQYIDGNLLAADQELRKLSLLHGKSQIDERHIADAISDSSRYTVFDLTDACLEGKGEKAVSIVLHLRSENVADPILLWSLSRELRVLAKILRAQASGANFQDACQQAGVVRFRQQAYKQHAARLRPARLKQAHQLACLCDAAIKKANPLPIEQLLCDFALALSGQPPKVCAPV
ncbi:DNA polymerase III subunit delta [Allohahella marinimesophila]|uniref:DNA polymerase III subunit delta n=1 Tax=Allohahella marinimesophila TaxID=1054972 RepID=A0ABP7PR65_9GAMM